jgi:hypothetical protein
VFSWVKYTLKEGLFNLKNGSLRPRVFSSFLSETKFGGISEGYGTWHGICLIVFGAIPGQV